MLEKKDTGWSEWGHHILLELERLNRADEKIREDHAGLRDIFTNKLVELSNKIDTIVAVQSTCKIAEINTWTKNYDTESIISSVKDLREWKKDISEIVSVTQLDKLYDDVQSLKSFKVKATTIFIVVQTIMGILLSLFKFQILPT